MQPRGQSPRFGPGFFVPRELTQRLCYLFGIVGILSFLFGGCGKQPATTGNPADQQLLRLVETSLRSSGLEAVAKATYEGDRLLTYDRRLAIVATVKEAESGKVHAHITAMLANPAAPGGADRLEACIFGFGKLQSEAMSQAANVWLQMVGAPVLSALAARPLLEADHFEGDEPWGVPGAHGFVGPFAARG